MGNKVETQDDFDKALRVTQIMNKLCYIEICTDSDDMPELSEKMVASFKKNSKEKVEAIPETYSTNKPELNITKGIVSFATKVRESLR